MAPDAGEPAPWRQDPLQWRVPLAGGARQEALPHARCTGIRRAKGKPERAQARPVHHKHGLFTRDAIAERRRIQVVLGEARKLLEEMK